MIKEFMERCIVHEITIKENEYISKYQEMSHVDIFRDYILVGITNQKYRNKSHFLITITVVDLKEFIKDSFVIFQERQSGCISINAAYQYIDWIFANFNQKEIEKFLPKGQYIYDFKVLNDIVIEFVKIYNEMVMSKLDKNKTEEE